MAIKVKGAAILARRAYVAEHHGDEKWREVLDRLAPEAREVVGGALLSSQWYPFSFNDALDRAIVEVVGRGDRGVFKEIGRASARENLGGSHRPFLAPGDPNRFLSRTPQIYRFYYDTGHREYEETGPDSGTMTTYSDEPTSANDCLTVIGWYEEALAMCGAKRVRITEERCRAEGAPCCRYHLSWEL